MPIIVESSVGPDGPGVPGALLHAGQVSLGGVTFGATDDYGVEWILENLSGWDDSGTTGSFEQRANDHGAWVSPAYLPPLLPTIEGSLVASSYAAASRALDRLKAAVSLSPLTTLQVAEDGERILRADVRQGGEILTNRRGGWASFSVALIAPDPRKYDVNLSSTSTGLPQTSGGWSLPSSLPASIEATTVSGVLVASNAGNMSTRPTLRAQGPTPAGTQITHRGTGQTLTIPDEVPAGRVLVLDVDRRRALLDGTSLRRVTGAWFDYAPGDNEIAFTAPTYNPDALLVSEHRNAWR